MTDRVDADLVNNVYEEDEEVVVRFNRTKPKEKAIDYLPETRSSLGVLYHSLMEFVGRWCPEMLYRMSFDDLEAFMLGVSE